MSAQGETYTEHCRRIETQRAAERALNAELLKCLRDALPILDDAAQDTKALGPDFMIPAESLRLQAAKAREAIAKAEGGEP